MARSLHLYSKRVCQNHGGTIIARSKSYRDGEIKPVSRADIRVRFLALLLTIVPTAQACEEDLVPLFACEAANGRKFVELCASSPLDAESGSLVYRFGALGADGAELSVELEYPKERAGSLQRFFAATYTHRGIYTQSVRFVSGAYGYTVFTRAKGLRELDAGVEVRDRRTGKSTVIACSERPRFYIFELKDLAPCDDETPVGTACVK